MTSDRISQRLRRILASGTHRRADEDLELLARLELRPLRLQLEFLKPELTFQDHDVRHTIVVFGWARVPLPEAAREALAHAQHPGASRVRLRSARSPSASWSSASTTR